MMCRLSGYVADERLLERPFYQQFADTDWHLDFATNTNIAGTTQEAQNRYIRTLHDRMLVSCLCKSCIILAADVACSTADMASIHEKKL